MSFGSNVTPPRFGAGAPKKHEPLVVGHGFDSVLGSWETAEQFNELRANAEVEPDPEPIPDLPIHMNDITLNDCYRCGHRGNNPVPGCECCAREHHYAPPDPED